MTIDTTRTTIPNSRPSCASTAPPVLIAWGERDPYLTVEGARAYLRDQPDAELHLLTTGHFALEEKLERIAGLIRAFYATRVHPAALAADQ
jgi:pimeloyl-ACP methyl ester carboxylesterase